ncbi:MAG: TRAP transporter small permease [Proteobacteria bacterium]|nr:TRAP transporter small permease [Pseudomonadota bacterium]
MEFFIRWVNRLSQAIGVLSALMIVLAVVITCQMIVVRYFLNVSTVWQTEAVVYLMISATLLGLPYVQKLKGHVNVDLIPMLLPPAARKAVVLLSLFCAVGVLAVMAFYGYELTHIAFTRNWKSETVWAFPLWIPYLSIPVGLGLFCLQLLADFFETLRTKAEDIVVEGAGH